MAGEDYLFKAGIDYSDFEKGLNEFVNKAQQASDKVEVANNKVKASYDNTAKSLTTSSARAGESLNNLGRIAQDLPFGFVAISNNLNPLLESFQRLQKETGSTGAALKALSTGLIGAGGIGFALSAITSALTFASIGFQAWSGRVNASKKAVDEAKKANDEYLNSLEGVRRSLVQGAIDAQKELVSLDSLYQATQNETLSRRDRNEAADELQKQYPAIFANYTNEEILLGKSAIAFDKLKVSILAVARAEAARGLITENSKQQLLNEEKIRDLKSEAVAISKRAKELDKEAVTDATGISTSVANTLRETQELNDNKEKQNKLTDANTKLQEKALILQNEINKQQGIGGIGKPGGKTIAEEEAEKAAKKLLEDQKKAETEREAQEKAFQALLLKLQQDSRDANAKAIEDDEKREIAASDATFKTKAENASKEVKLFEGTAAERQKLNAALVTFEAANENAAGEARDKIHQKYLDKRLKDEIAAAAKEAKIQADAANALGGLSTDSLDRQIAQIEEKYKKLYDTIALAGQNSDEVEAKIVQAQNLEIANAIIERGNKTISENERVAVRVIGLDQQYADKSVDVQKKKELAILNVQLMAAQDRLDLLKKNGKTENDVEVENAEALIDALQKKIAGVGSKTKNDGTPEKDFLEKLGIGPKTSEGILNFAAGASVIGKETSDLFGAIADGLQRQVDARKAAVDADTKAIDDLQSNVDKQKALYDEGVANNYDALQKELEDKKAQREADQKNLEEVQKRQAALRKAQIIADGISQTSSLITASAKIFEATSGIPPPFGQILAGIAIGAMFAAFAASKISAVKAAGQIPTQSFAEGGVVDGKPHSQGGKKYRATDGSGDVVELEGGEHVTRKDKTAKALPLLESINDGSVWHMGDDALRELLKGTGIHLSEAPKQTVKIVRERDAFRQQAALRDKPDMNDQVQSIKDDVKFMADKKRNEWEVWEDAKNVYKKRGGVTYVIKKP